MSEQREAATQRLLDEAEIRRVMVRYARGVDRRDYDLLASVWAHDAYTEYPDAGRGISGREAIMEWLKETLEQFQATMHFIGNQTVDLKGDKASVETYAVAYHRLGGGDRDWTIWVRYQTEFERRDGEWLIARHLPGRDMVRYDAVVPPPQGSP